MTKNLIIVESPNKCRKIEKLAGAGYICMSSCGHIYKLINGLAAIGDDYEPKYEVIDDKKSVVSKLKQMKKKVDNIYLACDPDREGEAIAFHLAKELGISKNAKRITFNEITKTAIRNALDNVKNIDMNMYNAQKTRRVLDRLMGFEISPLLWQNISKGNGLSAGRCQSPALNIIKKREDLINEFNSKKYFVIEGTLNFKLQNLNVKYENNIDTRELVIEILTNLIEAKYIVTQIKSKNSTQNPPAPYITSSLQQEASNLLGMNPKTTMSVAQKLYEKGLITYMRSDSTTISEEAKNMIKDRVYKKYGEKYYKNRDYKNKNKNSQEAHECIRMVDAEVDSPDDLTEQEGKLYSLIYKKSLACQMASKKLSLQEIQITARKGANEYLFKCNEEMVIFDGFGILYPKKDNNLSKIKEGDELLLDELEANEKKTAPKPRFTEASLVKELEKTGIGRPSTFSNIVSTLLDRGYVKKGVENSKPVKIKINYITGTDSQILEREKKNTETGNKGKLVITDIGIEVITYLASNFSNLIDEGLTCRLEEDLDHIANGKLKWSEIVKKFHNSFHEKAITLKTSSIKTSENIEFIKEIGKLDGSKYGIVKAKHGNAFAKLNGDKIKYLPIVKELYGTGKKIKLEALYYMFTLPKEVKYEGEKYRLHYGRNGYYLKNSKGNISLKGDLSDGSLPLNKSRNDFKLHICEEGNKQYGIVEAKYGLVYLMITDNIKTYKPINTKLYGEDGSKISKDMIKLLFTLPKKYDIDGNEYTIGYNKYNFILTYKNRITNLDGEFKPDTINSISDVSNLLGDGYTYNIGSKNKFTYSIINAKYGRTFVQTSEKKGKNNKKFLPINKKLYGENGEKITLEGLDYIYSLPKTYTHKGNKYTLNYTRSGFIIKYEGRDIWLDSDYSKFNGRIGEKILS